MPSQALLVPVALPIAASLIAAASGRFGWGSGRVPAAAGAWAALIALIAVWIPVRSTLDLPIGPLGFGTNFDLRLDAVGVAFGLMILAPAAVLLTLQKRTWRDATLASLAVSSAVLAIEARGALLTALAGCTAAILVLVLLEMEDPGAARPSWALILAAWLAVAWAGVVLQVLGGTADYDAVPVSALTAPVMWLLAFAAVFASGLFPWRGWATRIWTRPSLAAGGLTVATMQPLGIYLLLRAYEMGDGRYPQTIISLALAAWGVLVALGAAARAQSAATRAEFMAEIVPGLTGFALMSVAIGSSLGVVAAVILLIAAATIVACLPLLPASRGAASFLVIAAAAGVPPSLAFGGRLLGLDAAFEAGGAFGLLGVAGVATWLLSVAAAARSIGLPTGAKRALDHAAPRVAGTFSALALLAGPALGVLVVLAGFVAADVMPLPGGASLSAGQSITTVSTVMAATALLGPLLVFGIVALALSRPAPPASISGAAPPPLFLVPGSKLAATAVTFLRAATVPDQYRSMLNPRALERITAGGTPLLWLAALVALAFAVTR